MLLNNNLETIEHSIGEYMALGTSFFFYSSDLCLQFYFIARDSNAQIVYRFTKVDIDCQDTLLAYPDGKVLDYTKFYNNDKVNITLCHPLPPNLLIDA